MASLELIRFSIMELIDQIRAKKLNIDDALMAFQARHILGSHNFCGREKTNRLSFRISQQKEEENVALIGVFRERERGTFCSTL